MNFFHRWIQSQAGKQTFIIPQVIMQAKKKKGNDKVKPHKETNYRIGLYEDGISDSQVVQPNVHKSVTTLICHLI